MSIKGFEHFDTAVQKADIWLKEIMVESNIDSRKRAYSMLRAVLHTLRDRLTVDEAADLGAQLPILIRGIYYEEWNPSRTPIKDRHLEDFLEHIRDSFNAADVSIEPEKMARAVFNVLKLHVSKGEIKDIKGMLPESIRELWI